MILRARLWLLAVAVITVVAFLLVFQPITFRPRPHPIDRLKDLPHVAKAPVGPWRLYIYRPQPALKLGLDLQGGLRVVLQAIRQATVTYTLGEIAETEDERDERAELRQRVLALLDPTVFPGRTAELNPAGNAVDIGMPAADEKTMQDLARQILERLQEDFPDAAIAPDGMHLEEIDLQTMHRIQEIMRRRVDQFGVAEPVIQYQRPDRIVIELPGLRNPEEFVDLVKTTARMEWMHVPRDRADELQSTVTDSDLPTNQQNYTDEERRRIWAEIFDASTLVVTGADLKPTAQAVPTPAQGIVVRFDLRSDGARRWRDFTTLNIGEVVAIVLDGVPVSAPVVQSPMFASGQIEGTFTIEDATNLATLLNAGALPMSLEIIEQQVVSPTLGRDSLAASLVAGILGLAAILLFMLVYYRLPGLLADLALIIYALLLLAVFWMFGVTLTLPGLAGLLLTFGMAVDANILIFERVKEELRSGKTVRASIDAGFSRAWAAILDASLTTLLIAVVLFWQGTGPIKGFALALGTGILLSLFTAVNVTRYMMVVAANTRAGQHPGLFGLRRAPMRPVTPAVGT